MYTYDPNANKKNVDSENTNSLNEEDLFLAGGFDSFSEPNDNLNVGTPYMSGVEQFGLTQEAVDRWKVTRVPSFGEQFKASFNPANYHVYRNLSIPDVKGFIKTFCKYYFLCMTGILLIMILAITGLVSSLVEGATGTSVGSLLTGTTLFIFVVIFGIGYLLFPLFFRFTAWIYRWIARLMCLIINKDLSKEHLYSVSVYPLVPLQVISGILGVIAEFVSSTPFGMVMATTLLLINLLPIVYMSIAIPRMK